MFVKDLAIFAATFASAHAAIQTIYGNLDVTDYGCTTPSVASHRDWNDIYADIQSLESDNATLAANVSGISACQCLTAYELRLLVGSATNVDVNTYATSDADRALLSSLGDKEVELAQARNAYDTTDTRM